MTIVPISAEVIEHIHDVLVRILMPFDELVRSDEHRDRGRIEACLGRPFQTVFGEEAWPTLPLKAAVLFHSLICNHCFINGNKRTAVIALDTFLLTNDMMLLLTSNELYALARTTATANADGRLVDEVVQELAVQIEQSSLPRKDFERALPQIDKRPVVMQRIVEVFKRWISYVAVAERADKNSSILRE